MVVPGLLVPVQAHGGHDHGDTPTTPGDGGSDLPDAVLPNGTPWYSLLNGRLFLGNATNLSIPDGMRPLSLRGVGGWLAWFATHPEGGRNVYLYQPASGTGYWVTNDTTVKTDLTLGEDYVVWRTAVDREPFLRIHRISQGVTWSIPEPHVVSDFVIGKNALYYTRREGQDSRVWTINLLTGNVSQFSPGGSLKRDLVVAGDLVAWRDLSMSLPDVGFQRISTGTSGYFTRDIHEERRLVSDGRDFYWVVGSGMSRPELWRLDASTETPRATGITMPDVVDVFASDGLVVYRVTNSTGVSKLTQANPRNGAVHDLVDGLRIVDTPIYMGKVFYFLMDVDGRLDLVRFAPHPVAEKRKPTVVITDPMEYRPRSSAYQVKGYVDDPDGWGKLTAIMWRMGPEDNFTVLPPAFNFSFTIEPKNYKSANHIMQVMAVYEESPPMATFSQQNLWPRSGPLGYTFEPLRNAPQPTLLERLLENPGTVATLFFLAVAALLAAIRVTLWFRNKPGRIEYVRPDDEEPLLIRGGPRPPSGNP